MSEDVVLDPLVMGVFLLIGLLVLAGLVLQVIAMRHKKENWIHFAYKDSMFRNRKLAYNETGMKYINAQKWISIIIVGLAIVLAYLTTNP